MSSCFAALSKYRVLGRNISAGSVLRPFFAHSGKIGWEVVYRAWLSLLRPVVVSSSEDNLHFFGSISVGRRCKATACLADVNVSFIRAGYGK